MMARAAAKKVREFPSWTASKAALPYNLGEFEWSELDWQ